MPIFRLIHEDYDLSGALTSYYDKVYTNFEQVELLKTLLIT